MSRDIQIGGDHYKRMAIQPIDYITQNGLNWYQGNAVKYITRAPHKGALVDDIRKAIHYLQMWLEAENEHAIDQENT
jgi:hypothetical protein